MTSPTEFRGRQRLALIRDLAMGEWSHRELAEELGTDPGGIAEFEAVYAEDIGEVRQALAGRLALETAGLWVTKKQFRLAELQTDIEDINLVLADLKATGVVGGSEHAFGLGTRRHVNMLRAKMMLMRAVADETDPRGPRAAASDEGGSIVRYVIDAGDHASNLT